MLYAAYEHATWAKARVSEGIRSLTARKFV